MAYAPRGRGVDLVVLPPSDEPEGSPLREPSERKPPLIEGVEHAPDAAQAGSTRPLHVFPSPVHAQSTAPRSSAQGPSPAGVEHVTSGRFPFGHLLQRAFPGLQDRAMGFD